MKASGGCQSSCGGNLLKAKCSRLQPSSYEEMKIILPTKCGFSWKAEDPLLYIAARTLFNEE